MMPLHTLNDLVHLTLLRIPLMNTLFVYFLPSFILYVYFSTYLTQCRLFGLIHTVVFIRGASKIKLKKVNKKRTVTLRRVIIFLNISRRPLRVCLHCCLHQYKTLKAVATAMAVIVLLTLAKNLNKVFWVFLVVSPLFNHYQGYE